MVLSLHADPLPLRQDETGALRVGNTRVLLELVIDAFDNGETPETIVQSYDTLQLADVYSVLGYYLRHKDEVKAYLQQRDALGEEIRAKIEGKQDLSGIRERLTRLRTKEINGEFFNCQVIYR
jgi:uncharacterized protein (DUF433 family)